MHDVPTLQALRAARRLTALIFTSSGFGPHPEGWSAWSARPETAPRKFVDPAVSCEGAGTLGVSGDGNVAVFGG